MSDLFYVKLDLPGWGFLFIATVLLGVVYAYYVRTIPPLPTWRRWFLGVLRFLFFIFILLLFFNGTVVMVKKIIKPPILALLLDNSRSMEITDNGTPRAEQVQTVARQFWDSADSVQLQIFKFGEMPATTTLDSLTFDENYTDIAGGLRFVTQKLADENLVGILLVSDGIDNTGDDPIQVAARSPVPVFTVLVGDTTIPRDVVLESVRTNPVLRKNTESQAEVVFHHNGFAGQRVRVLLLHRGKVLASKQVTLGAAGLQQKVVLNFTPPQEGFQRFVVRIVPLKGEFQVKNNEKHVVVRVLKDRYNVFVFSGSPTFDRRALRIVSRNMPLFRFYFFTEKSGGQYYERNFNTALLDSAEAFLFYGFPTANTSTAHLNTIFQQIISRKLPVFWLPNRNTEPRRAGAFQHLWPFKFKTAQPFRGSISTNVAVITPYPFMYPDANPVDAVETWNALPPVEVFPGFQPPENARVLLYAGNRSRKPVPVFWITRGQFKQAVLAVANWGLWHFQLQDEPDRQAFFRQWLRNVLTWLVNREDLNPIQIKPVQKTVNVGEMVVFQGKVYDELFREVADAEVTITIWNDSLTENYTARAVGNGFYRLEVPGLTVGDYRYRVTATANGQKLGVHEGSFSVIPFHLELMHTRARADVLRAIAAKSGGRFYTVPHLPARLPVEHSPKTYFKRKEIVLLDRWYWLPFLILLVALEWFFRKRWGLL